MVSLESEFEVVILTLNVDDLDERAGSNNVIYLHGQLNQARSKIIPNSILDIGVKSSNIGDLAEDGNQLRSAIVWFGELVPIMELPIREIVDA